MVIRFGDPHVEQAQTNNDGSTQDHGVVDVPRGIRCPWPGHVDDGADAVDQCADVHRPAPGAEGEFAAWFPALHAGVQGREHDHLERQVDADGREADDGGCLLYTSDAADE